MKKLTMKTRFEVINSKRNEYLKAKRTQKTIIIDGLCLTTGLSRDRVKKLLSRNCREKRKRKAGSGRKLVYDHDLDIILLKLWELSDYASGKRFCAGINDLLDALIRFNELAIDLKRENQLRNISPATVDRRLKTAREKYSLKGKSTTKPGTLLKKQIPIRLANQWDENQAGFMEIDLVAHCGETAAGEYINTLNMTDIHTGWTETRAVRNKAQKHVFEALQHIRTVIPFTLKGIDSDNGSEFINNHLFKYCDEENILFTRSRPYRKNDNCHVEQKNWHLVRRNLGYGRFEGQHTVDLMNHYYVLLSFRTNFFDTHFKLVHKHRDGAKIVKRYNGPKSPYRRLLEDPTISQIDKDKLTEIYLSLNPIILKDDMIKLHKEIINRVVGLYNYQLTMKGDHSSELYFYE